jgi:tetratricopeptide (TPR) repeat protein
MLNLFEINPKIEALAEDVRYHHKALNACDDDFPYRADIKSNLAEKCAQIGHAYYIRGNLNDALKFYFQAVKQNPEHFQALNQIGLILAKQNKFIDARSYFQKIINLADNPHDLHHKIDAILDIALTHITEKKEGHFKKAYKYLLQAEKLSPGNQGVKRLKQQIPILEKVEGLLLNTNKLIIDKKWSEAMSTIKQAITLSPDNQEVIATYKMLQDLKSSFTLKASKANSIFQTKQTEPELQEKITELSFD